MSTHCSINAQLVSGQSARIDRSGQGRQTVTLAEQSTVTGIVAALAGYPEADDRQENTPLVFADVADALAWAWARECFTE